MTDNAKFDRRNFLKMSGAGLTVGLSGVAGCLSNQGGGDGGGGPTKMNIALSVPNWVPYAPVRLAEEKGYFEAFNVDIEIKAYGGGGEAQNALASGDEDIISFNGAGMAQAVGKGVEQKIVSGEQIIPNGWTLNVNQDSDISAMADIDSKKAGVTSKGSTTDFHALGAAAEAGIEVQTVPMGASGLISGLKEGQIDASSLFPPLNFIAESDGWGTRIFEFAELGSTLPAVWVASQNAIDNKADAVEGVLKAVFKGTKYMQRNRDESLDFLESYTESPEPIRKKSYDEVLTSLTDNGSMGIAEVENTLELARTGGAEELPSADEVFTDQFLPVEVSL